MTGVEAATRAAPAPGPITKARTEELRASAQAFEAAFLAEMFAHAGLAAARSEESGFGGGVGEDAFASMLSRAWAEKMTEAGGVGLTERLFQALMAKEAGHV